MTTTIPQPVIDLLEETLSKAVAQPAANWRFETEREAARVALDSIKVGNMDMSLARKASDAGHDRAAAGFCYLAESYCCDAVATLIEGQEWSVEAALHDIKMGLAKIDEKRGLAAMWGEIPGIPASR